MISDQSLLLSTTVLNDMHIMPLGHCMVRTVEPRLSDPHLSVPSIIQNDIQNF